MFFYSSFFKIIPKSKKRSIPSLLQRVERDGAANANLKPLSLVASNFFDVKRETVF